MAKGYCLSILRNIAAIINRLDSILFFNGVGKIAEAPILNYFSWENKQKSRFAAILAF